MTGQNASAAPEGGNGRFARHGPAVPTGGTRHANEAVELAGFWRRAACGLVDCAVLAPPLLFFLWLWTTLLWVDLPDVRLGALDWLAQLPYVPDPVLRLGGLVALGIAVLYFFFFTGLWNATPGQRLLRVQVVGATGQRPGWLRSALRSVLLPVAFGYLFLGVLWIAFDRLRQGWHDKLAGTYVVMKPPGS